MPSMALRRIFREKLADLRFLWSFAGWLVAYPVRFYFDWTGIDLGSSSTAAIGYVFVPVAAGIEALPYAATGFALGSIVVAARSRERRHVVIAATASVLVLAFFTWRILDAKREHHLIAEVESVAVLDDDGLRSYLDGGSDRDNRFVLAAIAMNPAASGSTLGRIAALEDPALHRKLFGSRGLLRDNRRGLAVMRLVVRNQKVLAEALEALAKSDDPYVLGDVAGHEKTPRASLEGIWARRGEIREVYLIDSGMARNAAAPAEILRELAERSRNQYVLYNLMRNRGAPEDVKALAARRVDARDYDLY